MMVCVVTGVGFLIHVYSVGYMADDARMAKGTLRALPDATMLGSWPSHS